MGSVGASAGSRFDSSSRCHGRDGIEADPTGDFDGAGGRSWWRVCDACESREQGDGSACGLSAAEPVHRRGGVVRIVRVAGTACERIFVGVELLDDAGECDDRRGELHRRDESGALDAGDTELIELLGDVGLVHPEDQRGDGGVVLACDLDEREVGVAEIVEQVVHGVGVGLEGERDQGIELGTG